MTSFPIETCFCLIKYVKCKSGYIKIKCDNKWQKTWSNVSSYVNNNWYAIIKRKNKPVYSRLLYLSLKTIIDELY